MATHSSTLAWKIPWTEEPGRLPSMRSLRVRHNWATSLSLSTFMHWRRKWQPTPVFLPRESQGRTGEPDGLPSMGSHRVGHDWSDLAAAQISHLDSERLSYLPRLTQTVNSRTTMRNSLQLWKKNWNTCDSLRASFSEGKNRKWQFTVEEKEITCKDMNIQPYR